MACSAHLGDGIRQVGLTGKPVLDPATQWPCGPTPRDSGALWEFCRPGFAADPRLAEGWTAQRWATTRCRSSAPPTSPCCWRTSSGRRRCTARRCSAGCCTARRCRAATFAAYWAVGETVIEARQPLDADSAAGRPGRQRRGRARSPSPPPPTSSRRHVPAQQGHRLDPVATPGVRSPVHLDPSFGLNLAFTSRRVPGDTALNGLW
ncbi:MAG: hypothetical protein R2749_07070 [Acidimicrobiales bacterium]